MKKLMVFIMLLFLICGSAASVMSKNGPSGAAPNSGDGVSDGSGMDGGPNSDRGKSNGSAPNSGDGVSDGSGW